jgi:hypothetical protein
MSLKSLRVLASARMPVEISGSTISIHWDEFHAWMLDKMERFRSLFADRVKHLPTSTAAGVVSDEKASGENDP